MALTPTLRVYIYAAVTCHGNWLVDDDPVRKAAGVLVIAGTLDVSVIAGTLGVLVIAGTLGV